MFTGLVESVTLFFLFYFSYRIDHHELTFFMSFKDHFDLMGLTEEMLSGQWKCVSFVTLTSFTPDRRDHLELCLI